MFKGFAVVAVRPVTESVLDCPVEMEVGVKVHVAPLLQDNTIGVWKVLGPVAEIVKVAVFDPIKMTFDR